MSRVGIDASVLLADLQDVPARRSVRRGFGSGMDINGNNPGRVPPIRVLVADDSVVMRSALARMLKDNPRIQLCGFAVNGIEAVSKARLLKPDVTLDVLMPAMDGIEALRQIMQHWPCPVIMVSSLTRHGAEVTVEALSMGAFDHILKEELFHPGSTPGTQHLLTDRVEAAARSVLYSNRGRYYPSQGLLTQRQDRPGAGGARNEPPGIIAVGASTGGPKALESILTALPGDLPAPVVVVQHVPPGFTSALAQRLDGLCELRVHEARQGERLQSGCVYIAPAGQHMTVFDTERHAAHACLSDIPHATIHKPSVDVLMLSVAKVFGRHSLGIILTGMGTDGLQGMAAIQDAGGITIGQDEATCAVYGMPRVCAEQGVLQRILPLEAIADQLVGEFKAAAHA